MEEKLPVVEIFASLQGEGFYSGSPAAFIRLAGCDVGCIWCDSINSWSAGKHPKLSIDEIASRVGTLDLKKVVITGGEPLMYNLDLLTEKLKSKGHQLHIETSGVYPLSGQWDWICLSPKRHKLPGGNEVFKIANELKIVITDREDFSWAEDMKNKVDESCRLFLQPEYSSSENILPTLFKYVLKNSYWNISIQLHKFMNIP